LLKELKALDAAVSGMLAGGQGNSSGAYSAAYRQWLDDAPEVESALSTMARLLGEAGKAYADGEQRSAAALGSLGDG